MTENKTTLNRWAGQLERKKSLIFLSLSFEYGELMQTDDNFDDSLKGKGRGVKGQEDGHD